MSYNFEMLGDERFQQLAQALLTAAFPNAQCLPVGQPDGGRDAFFIDKSAQGGTIVFQVKYSRSPDSKDERTAVEEAISSEQEKVKKLKSRGAKAYYLITNVRGTAHLDVGSVDRTNKLLSDTFDLPSYCWWRDDLESRINALANVKWSFPEILRGTDVLQLIVEGANREVVDARTAAIRAYIAAQHRQDSEVKFKQVELQNKILDLFVDIPVGRLRNPQQQKLPIAYADLDTVEFESGVDEPSLTSFHVRNRQVVTAATRLLNYPLEFPTNQIVLEGAPGQGKSTITQYICQINRIRFLDRAIELNSIPIEHLSGPIRLPFRVDLRDYAAWITGRNPFVLESAPPDGALAPGLERFIAAQVGYVSGGHPFTVSDLVAITKASHMLIVLDGFDEVADIPTRTRLVEEISKAAVRFQANSRSVQIIVTSRPAAFANSPGFADSDWLHLELLSMLPSQISEYAKRWMAAKSLSHRDRIEFTELLNQKLEQPHMRDLARNPMQLTILLALIQTRGLSLPDKRTALYDSYMELFFSREAEKSRVVREYRDLLVDIHRYLAWYLHAAAEGEKNAGGSISELELKQLLERYLLDEGHKTSLVNELFTGMVERVVALVSRVQGTFEFEVQPLREYFAARHLYETAPYSPPGNERKGTKPERFEALARNFYWLNVARFFSGCFSRGELSGLADGIEDLARADGYSLLGHPRLLALMLLGDWVFAQQPLTVQRVVEEILRLPGFKILLASESDSEMRSRFTLPEKNGREFVLEGCLKRLSQTIPRDERNSLFGIIRDNLAAGERVAFWKAEYNPEDDFESWLAAAEGLDVIEELPLAELSLWKGRAPEAVVPALIRAQRWDAIYAEPDWFKFALDGALAGTLPLRLGSRSRSYTPLQFVHAMLSPQVYFVINQRSARFPAKRRFYGLFPSGLQLAKPSEISAGADVVDRYSATLLEAMEVGVDGWVSTLVPWSKIVDTGVDIFGPQWAFGLMAILAAGVKSQVEVGSWTEDGWKINMGISERIRFARLKSGNITWWSGQLSNLVSPDEKKLAITALVTWGTPKTIAALANEINDFIDGLSGDDWGKIYSSVLGVQTGLNEQKSTKFETVLNVSQLSPRTALLISGRAGEGFRLNVFEKLFSGYAGQDKYFLQFRASIMLEIVRRDAERWPEALACFRASYDHGVIVPIYSVDNFRMPIDLAYNVCGRADCYQFEIIKIAQKAIAADTGKKAKKLADVAVSERWFH